MRVLQGTFDFGNAIIGMAGEKYPVHPIFMLKKQFYATLVCISNPLANILVR